MHSQKRLMIVINILGGTENIPETIEFYTQTIGFALDAVYPKENPQ
jgi:hypothetical protein